MQFKKKLNDIDYFFKRIQTNHFLSKYKSKLLQKNVHRSKKNIEQKK